MSIQKTRIIAKILAVVMIAVCLAVSFTGCGKNNTDTIKIGFIGPLTGDVAVYGISARNGAKMYISELNAAGGINGKQIEFIELDDKGDPTEAINAYNRLVANDEVVAIIGAVTSDPTKTVAQASQADGIPIITPTATHPDITLNYGKNIFRSCFLDPFQGSTMAKFVYDKLSAKTAAIIYQTTDSYSTGLMQSFTETAKEVGLTIVATEGYSKGDVDFKSQLTNIKEMNPDVLFVPDYYNNVYLIASQAKEIGLEATLIGVDGTDGVLQLDGADYTVFNGMYFANHYSTEDESELVQNFLKGYEKEYGTTPNAFATLGYDAAMILCAAIDTVNKAGTEITNSAECWAEIIEALKATDLECVTGHITYDENSDPIKSCAIITVKAEKDADGNISAKYELFGKY